MWHEKLQLNLLTPWSPVFEGAVDGVVVPTLCGQITVLPNHKSMIAVVVPGELIIQQDSTEQSYAVAGGFLEVRNGVLNVLADSSEQVSDIDESRAEKSLHAALTGLEQERDEKKRAELLKAKQQAEVRIAVKKKAGR